MSSDISDVTVVSDAVSIGADDSSAKASLVMIYGEYLGRRFAVDNTTVVVGRSPECTVHLTDDSVSRQHCKLQPGGGGVILIDLGSTNGTYVNSTAVSARPLKDGDSIQIGRSIFKFLSGSNIETAYHEEIYRLKTTDALTGANNKRAFDEEIRRELHRFFRYHRPLTLILMDIDHFKNVNDTYGHLAGDRVLSELGKIIGRLARREDTFCRYGGEEFSLLLPETDIQEASRRAEEIRAKVESSKFEFEDFVIPITLSCGVAEAIDTYEEPDEFVSMADKRLYEAKDSGRNRVIPPPPT